MLAHLQHGTGHQHIVMAKTSKQHLTRSTTDHPHELHRPHNMPPRLTRH